MPGVRPHHLALDGRRPAVAQLVVDARSAGADAQLEAAVGELRQRVRLPGGQPGRAERGGVHPGAHAQVGEGGQVALAPELTLLLAPYVNSYKRFQAASFAPTKAVWSKDNRTAGFRVVGGGPSLRVECRIPGADANPYLAFAALLAAGLFGIEQGLELEPAFEGDAYRGENIQEIPKTLRAAIDCLERSAALRAAFGDEVVEHYLHAARWEQLEYDRRITDHELIRGFERA